MKLCDAYRLWLQKNHLRGNKFGSEAIQGHVLQMKAPIKKDSAEIRDSKGPKSKITSMHNIEGPSCWLCLEAGPDESGQPLRRDCACRGKSAGFAHLSCIVQYAEHTSLQADNDSKKAWYQCPNCWQYYQNELVVDLATKFVAFAKNHRSGVDIHLTALNTKLRALTRNEKLNEAEDVANEILSMIEPLRSSSTSIPESINEHEATFYNNLGHLALRKETEHSAKAALAHFEKARDLFKAMGITKFVLILEKIITDTKSKCGEDICIDETLKRSRELYEFTVQSGKEDLSTSASSGLSLAIALFNDNQGIEAERLVTKLAITSKRVFGSDHKQTQQTCSWLQRIKTRVVAFYLEDELQAYEALRYAENGEMCIIQGPMADPRNAKEEKKFAISSKYIMPTLGTPVVCHGMDSPPHLIGKIGDLISCDRVTDCYKVQFQLDGNHLETCMVKRGNLRILFELPNV